MSPSVGNRPDTKGRGSTRGLPGHATGRLPWVILLVGLVAGCGPSAPRQNPISGSVTFKEHPVQRGTISFRSDDDRYVATGDIVDGKYEIPRISGLPAGEYTVAITYPDPKVPPPPPDEPPGESRPVRELLPAKYNEHTELKAEIKDGPNDVDFHLR